MCHIVLLPIVLCRLCQPPISLYRPYCLTLHISNNRLRGEQSNEMRTCYEHLLRALATTPQDKYAHCLHVAHWEDIWFCLPTPKTPFRRLVVSECKTQFDPFFENKAYCCQKIKALQHLLIWFQQFTRAGSIWGRNVFHAWNFPSSKIGHAKLWWRS